MNECERVGSPLTQGQQILNDLADFVLRTIRAAALLACAATLLTAARQTRATDDEWQLVGLAGSPIRTLAIDPQTPSTLYAVLEGTILKSLDTGRIWEPTGYDGNAWWLLIDPTAPDRLYALDEQGAVAKSVDGAATWMDANTGLTRPLIGIALDAAEASTLWGADYVFVVRSTDAAETWSEYFRPPHGITAFAPAQTRSGVLIGLYRDGAGFVGSGASNVPGQATRGVAAGAYCPVDAAQSPIYSVTSDPVRPNVFYAGYGSGICKTEDNGSTWRFLPSSAGTRIGFIDPFHPDTLYVFSDPLLRSTDGGETWGPFEQGFPPGISVGGLATDANGRLYAATSDGLYALGTSEATATPSPTRTPTDCAGDCDGNGQVAIGELVLLVSIVLDDATTASCEAGDRDHDGSTQIDDLLAAVGSALHGCAGPSPSPTPTADSAESETGFCYESASCFPCDVYPCRPVPMSRAFCCHLSLNGSFSWCPADAFDASTNSCARCTHPCK